MKVLSLNFLTCAVKACKSSSASYPLHPKDAELVQDDLELNAQLLINLMPRIDWPALSATATEVCIVNRLLLFHIMDGCMRCIYNLRNRRFVRRDTHSLHLASSFLCPLPPPRPGLLPPVFLLQSVPRLLFSGRETRCS